MSVHRDYLFDLGLELRQTAFGSTISFQTVISPDRRNRDGQHGRPLLPSKQGSSPAATEAGVQAFTFVDEVGQIWVTVRNGLIENAGVNPPGAFR